MSDKVNSIGKNFLYSGILTVSNYLFPLLIFPYVSRVLGVTNIGICNFVDSIIEYFTLFSMMGISILGIREIAATKSDRTRMSKAFTCLVILNVVFSLVAIAVLLVIMFTVSSLQEYRSLLFVGVFKLLGNVLLIEWFFKGREDFKYITNRTIFVKLLYVVAIYLLIKERSDYMMYYILTMLMIFANSLFNCYYARKLITFSFDKQLLRIYLRPFLYLGLYMLITSMYVNFNVIWLGFVKGPQEVGYYTTATKLYVIIMALFTAFTGVMLPRLSSLLSENNMEEFRRLINKSLEVLTAVAFPCLVFAIVFCSQIIHILAGSDYDGAILPAQIVMPLLFVIGYEQILVIQILMPTQKDTIIFRNAIIGAVVGLSLNFILVPQIGAIGSAIVWLASETVVLLFSQYSVTKLFAIRFPIEETSKNLLLYIPLLMGLILIQISMENEYQGFSVGVIVAAIYFVVLQKVYLKNPFIISLFNKINLRR